MDFIRANLGASQAEERRIESLEQEVNGYKKEVSDLKTQLEAVKGKLSEYEKATETKDAAAAVVAEVKNEEKPAEASVPATESNQTNVVGGAEADVVKDKISESEKAATPSSAASTVDSAKAANDSENADVAKSNSAEPKADDEKKPEAAADEADQTKTSDTTVAAAAAAAEKDK